MMRGTFCLWALAAGALSGCLVVASGDGGADDAKDPDASIDASAALSSDGSRPDGYFGDRFFFDSPPVDVPPVDQWSPEVVEPEVVPPPSYCGALARTAEPCPSMCGNGTVDRCGSSAEDCEFTTAATCESLGFRGGAIACLSSCLFDTTRCLRCASSPEVLGCGAPTPGIDVQHEFGLAAKDDRFAIAYASANGINSGVNLVVFDANGALIGQSPCVYYANITSASVAPMADGWMVVSSRGFTPAGSLHSLQRFGNDGNRLGQDQSLGDGFNAKITAHPSGLQALIRHERVDAAGNRAVVGRIVGNNGSPYGLDQDLAWATVDMDFDSAIATNNGYYVASRFARGGRDTIAVTRTFLAGSWSSPLELIENYREFPQLIWTSSGIALLHGDFGATPPALRFHPIGSAGMLPVPQAPVPSLAYGRVVATSNGAEAFVAQAVGNEIRVSRLLTSGASAMTTTPIVVGRSTHFTASDRVQIARVGSRLVVAWTDSTPSGRALAFALVALP